MFSRQRPTKKPATIFAPAAQKVARPKSRVALRATWPSASVAENGHFDQNVAPAQQLIISLVHAP